MIAIGTWLRQLGGALFACLVLCLTVAPMADSLICASEVSATESVSEQATAASHDHDGKSHPDSGDACVHGHCHQTPAPAQPVDVELAEASTSAVSLTPAETGLPPSRAPDGPMEPPRA